MAYNADKSQGNTSLYYSYFQTLFDTIDTTAFFWQPFTRAVGASQLEVATLQSRQAQALVHWAHEIMRPAPSPMHYMNANAELWARMIENYVDVAPRVAAAGTPSAPVVPLRVKQPRDRLVLLDRDQETGERYERKVA